MNDFELKLTDTERSLCEDIVKDIQSVINNFNDMKKLLMSFEMGDTMLSNIKNRQIKSHITNYHINTVIDTFKENIDLIQNHIETLDQTVNTVFNKYKE